MRHVRIIASVFGACAVCLCAAAASAQAPLSPSANPPAATPANAPAEAPAAPNGQSGMVVVRDPESGKLRAANSEEARAMATRLAPLFNMSTDGLVEEAIPSGGFKKDLKGRFQSAAVARKNSDGSTSWVCADNADHAARFLVGTTQPSATLEEK